MAFSTGPARRPQGSGGSASRQLRIRRIRNIPAPETHDLQFGHVQQPAPARELEPGIPAEGPDNLRQRRLRDAVSRRPPPLTAPKGTTPNSDNPRPKDLPECGVLITGGTSGVGLATALEFATAGVPRIAIAGRDPGRGAAAAARVRDVGAECTFYASDTTAAARTAEAAAGFLGGGIDIFVNTTAPRVRPTPFSKVAADDIKGLLTELILPPMRMVHAVLPTMRQQRSGVIINMASDAAKTATPGEALIGAAMAAIVMFTRTLAIEGKRYGIRANVVTPSLISGTGLTDYLLDDGFSGKLFAAASAKADLGVPDAGDVASLIVFLAGPGANRLTGQAIRVNGGISAS